MAAASRSAWMQAWQGDLVPSAAARRSAARVDARMRTTRYFGREATAHLPQPTPEVQNYEALPELKVVVRRRPRWGLLLGALALAALLLVVAIIVPVMVNSAATDIESRVGRLAGEQKALATTVSGLSAQIATSSSPERVTEQAARLGLKPAQSVHYLQAGIGTAVSEGDTTVGHP
jgi:cell division protein FtsL